MTLVKPPHNLINTGFPWTADSLTVGAGNTVAQPLASQSQTFVATQPQPCVTTAQQAQPVTACGHVTQGKFLTLLFRTHIFYGCF